MQKGWSDNKLFNRKEREPLTPSVLKNNQFNSYNSRNYFSTAGNNINTTASSINSANYYNNMDRDRIQTSNSRNSNSNSLDSFGDERMREYTTSTFEDTVTSPLPLEYEGGNISTPEVVTRYSNNTKSNNKNRWYVHSPLSTLKEEEKN
jgi:hypothetical protein